MVRPGHGASRQGCDWATCLWLGMETGSGAYRYRERKRGENGCVLLDERPLEGTQFVIGLGQSSPLSMSHVEWYLPMKPPYPVSMPSSLWGYTWSLSTVLTIYLCIVNSVSAHGCQYRSLVL